MFRGREDFLASRRVRYSADVRMYMLSVHTSELPRGVSASALYCVFKEATCEE